MFHDIPQPILNRMRYLEAIDARDRSDGTPQARRLRQIAPDTGRFLALLAASTPAGAWIEIGTSAGYSTLWLSLAGRQVGRTVDTFELADDKVQLAEETFTTAGVGDVVRLHHGDALALIPAFQEIAFCFLDTEKELYAACYELVIPRLIRGGMLVADNATSHAADLQPVLERALSDDRVDGLVVPVGRGELLCRKR